MTPPVSKNRRLFSMCTRFESSKDVDNVGYDNNDDSDDDNGEDNDENTKVLLPLIVMMM